MRELHLYEISPVPLGMNALTSVRAVKAAVIWAMKAAIPPKEMPMAPEDTAWDAGAVLKGCSGAKQLRLVHAWVDPEGDPEAKSSYKLPHHLPDGTVVWNGVKAAGAAVMGARGGASIPDTDIPGVEKHLGTHYAQFGKAAPWEKGLDAYFALLAQATTEIKEGRVLSSANKDTINAAVSALQSALSTLNELLAAADPDAGKRLAQSALLVKRLRAVELALALR